jgi:integrase
VANRKKFSVVKLDIDDLTPEQIIAFLQYLEDERKNAVTSRNIRLAAIHAFFRYIAGQHPDKIEHCQRILGVPFKRARSRPIEYLERNEIQAVFDAVNRTTVDGRPDYALLATMFNTGARAQELVNLRPCDLQLIQPFHAHIIGKGRKERLCPLWPQTAELLRTFYRQWTVTFPWFSKLV